MGKLRFNYRSEVLGPYVDITVVYPTDTYRLPETDALKNRSHGLLIREKKDFFAPGMKFQTVYLMHGGGDDDTLTYRYTNAELFAQRNHVMLVTPNIANSFGADACYGVPYQTFLTEELPLVIQTLFASSPEREDNFIMGYAMGGNVALAAALALPAAAMRAATAARRRNCRNAGRTGRRACARWTRPPIWTPCAPGRSARGRPFWPRRRPSRASASPRPNG